MDAGRLHRRDRQVFHPTILARRLHSEGYSRLVASYLEPGVGYPRAGSIPVETFIQPEIAQQLAIGGCFTPPRENILWGFRCTGSISPRPRARLARPSPQKALPCQLIDRLLPTFRETFAVQESAM